MINGPSPYCAMQHGTDWHYLFLGGLHFSALCILGGVIWVETGNRIGLKFNRIRLYFLGWVFKLLLWFCSLPLSSGQGRVNSEDSEGVEDDGVPGCKGAESPNKKVEDNSLYSLLDNDMNEGSNLYSFNSLIIGVYFHKAS